MTREDLFLMLRSRQARLEDDLRILNVGRHDFGDGEDALVEEVLAVTKRAIAMLEAVVEVASEGRL